MTDTAPSLREAAQAVLDRWANPKWSLVRDLSTDSLMDALRAALAAQPAPAWPIRCWCCGSPNWPIGSGGIEHAGDCLAALRNLYAVVIEQNRAGTSWKPERFGRMMSALADASYMIDTAPIAQQAPLEVTTGEVPKPMSEVDQARLNAALNNVFGWGHPIAQQAALSSQQIDALIRDSRLRDAEPDALHDFARATEAELRGAQQAAPEQARQPTGLGFFRKGCNYLAPAGRICNKCGHAHTETQVIATVAQKGE